MPVPKASTDNSPRRLLRDVVFDKLLEAIQNGTLQPGERLNDDELVQWLGVSRTPIREAIARLVDYGLVDMEANRFTRIATPDLDTWAQSLQLLHGLHSLSARWATPGLTDDDVAVLRGLTDHARELIAAEDIRFVHADVQVMRFFVERSGNTVLATQIEGLYARIEFFGFSARDAVDWKDVQKNYTAWLTALDKAAKARDAEAAAAAILPLADVVTTTMDRLKAAAA
jgi:DNA-binding GntR family transcriptional regulator